MSEFVMKAGMKILGTFHNLKTLVIASRRRSNLGAAGKDFWSTSPFCAKPEIRFGEGRSATPLRNGGNTRSLIFLSFLLLGCISAPGLASAQSLACHGPPGCPIIGNVCPDGSVFAGCGGDKYYPFFVTRCDAGYTWSGSACTGTYTPQNWNNGNTSGFVTTSLGVADGRANTIALSTGGTYQDSNSSSGGVQPHKAAQYCTDLTIHGRTDWYLPAAAELHLIYINGAAIGNLNLYNYWSSSESSNTQAISGVPDTDVSLGPLAKQGLASVRCARRN